MDGSIAREQQIFGIRLISGFSDELANAVLESFGRESWPEVLGRVAIHLVTGPGTLWPTLDLYTKLVVLLLYLAPDNNAEHLGTSLYRPKQAGFSCPEQQALRV